MNNFFYTDATLGENNPTYVTRDADAQLCEALLKGKFCYVFNSRQTGKSSLRVQTVRRLREEKVTCGYTDISMVSTESTTIDQWYLSLINRLCKSIGLRINIYNWWKKYELLSALDRFNEFIENILLVNIKNNIVLFFDEIDSVLSLNFSTDDFFAFIRACHNQRVDNTEYQRLTFCLLGVAIPSNLIKDKRRTPFNIGQAIELCGFTFAEAKEVLLPGFEGKVNNPEAILKEVIEEWTGGQPFLTQRLCQLIVENASSKEPDIKEIVRKCIIENWEANDQQVHLRTINDRLREYSKTTSKHLKLYRQILIDREVKAVNSPEEMQLRLSGLIIKTKNNTIQVYNRIYESVFDQQWVNETLAEFRPYADELTSWLSSGRQDESRILRGKALEEAWIWSKGKDLGEDDYQFLTSSLLFEQKDLLSEASQEILAEVQGIIIDFTKNLANKVENPLYALKEVIFWTGGHQKLTHSLCEKIIMQDILPEVNNNVSKWIEEVVKTNFIDNWKDEENNRYFKKIYNYLISSQKSFNLLQAYKGVISTDRYNIEHDLEELLIDCGLIVSQKQRLKVSNPIYQSVFNKQWVNQQIDNLLPFSDALGLWLESQQDQSFLLKGESLQKALDWSQDKKLSDWELDFLTASRRFAEQMEFEQRSPIISSSNSWICDGIPKDGKEYLDLGGSHEPYENYSPDCEICGLPKVAAINSSKTILIDFSTFFGFLPFFSNTINSSNSSSFWICDGIPKNGKNYSYLSGSHQPYKNFSDDCEFCGLPKEAVIIPSSKKILSFNNKFGHYPFWSYPLFQIPALCFLLCSVAVLLFWQFQIGGNNNSQWLIISLGGMWISLIWAILLPLDYLILRGSFNLPMHISGKISLFNTLFWTAFALVIIIFKLSQIKAT